MAGWADWLEEGASARAGDPAFQPPQEDDWPDYALARAFQRVADDVRMAIDDLGWTVADVARGLGQQPATFQEKMRGARDFTLRDVLLLDALLGDHVATKALMDGLRRAMKNGEFVDNMRNRAQDSMFTRMMSHRRGAD